MRIWIRGTALLGALLAVAALPAMAADQEGQIKLLEKLHSVNLMEIDMGNLAVSKTQNDAVKDYANKLVSDHQSADKALMSFAGDNQFNIDTAMQPTPDMKKMDKKMDALRKLDGAGFDQQYLATMMKGHDGVIREVQAARDQYKGQKIAAFLDQMLPTLKAHRDDAAKLQHRPASARNAPKP